MNLITFRFSDVKEKEQAVWQKRFEKWRWSTQTPIAMEQSVLREIISPDSDPQQQEQSAKLIVSWGDKLGAILAHRDLSTSQIRAIFGEVKQIQAKLKISQLQGTVGEVKVWNRLRLLMPKMSYRAKKEKSKGVDDLAKIFENAIPLVIDGEPSERFNRFENFVNFFEAILAYHKFYGGN